MTVEEFYDGLFGSAGAQFAPWAELTSAQQKPFEDAYESTIENKGDQVARRLISNAEMLTIKATPIVLVPAVPNHIILPIRVISAIPVVTTARGVENDIKVSWQLGASSFTYITVTFDIKSMRGSTSSGKTVIYHALDLVQDTSLATLVNKPVVAHNISAGEYTGGSVDNIVTFIVSYHLLKV